MIMRNFESKFKFESKYGIIKPQHLGISGNRCLVTTPFNYVTDLESLQAPPYANTGFRSEVKIGGESVKCSEYTWRINLIERKGAARNFEVSSLSVIPPYKNAVLEAVKVKNTSGKDIDIPLELWYKGNSEYLNDWIFPIPKVTKHEADEVVLENKALLLKNRDGAAFAITSSLEFEHFALAKILKTRVSFKPDEEKVFYFSFHSGHIDTVEAEYLQVMADYERYVDEAFLFAENEEKRLLSALPEFKSDNEAYEKFYYRSLATLLLNRWEIPLFKLNPYYSTGGTTGGCMCSYLWDYAGPWNIHPLVDKDVTKEEIKAFLAVDLSSSYAIMPVDGKKNGPWYQINQEKIIALIYHYLTNTGDFAFLNEQAGEKTVIEWVKFHAYFGDNLEKEANLIDYGVKGEDHLELRRGIPYHGIMPDLNMRRYKTYERASEILSLYGTPDDNLMQRAKLVAALTKEKLWDKDKKWFKFIIDGKEDYRYTVQMFKFLDSGAADKEIVEGLVSHLNDKEFLSDFGLHSMSKLDEAYDQVDIDNGGGGICSLFVPVILEQLYKIGKCEIANDILNRVLWWGERMPYWGDSLTANAIAYREDTPLQATIGSSAAAQMIIFGIFGVKSDFYGNITINPVKNPPDKNMRLINMKLRGKIFSIYLNEQDYTVETENIKITKPYGEKTAI